MTEWYVWSDGETLGPWPDEEVRARGFPAGTYVCPAGDQNWHLIEEFPELGAAVLPPPLPVAAPEHPRPPDWRRRVFVIHGKAIRLDDAFEKVLGILKNKMYHFDGHFWVKGSDVNLVRYLVNERHEAPLLAALEILVATKVGISQYYAPPAGSAIERELVAARDEWALGRRRTPWARVVAFVAASKLEEHGAPWNDAGFTSEKDALEWAAAMHRDFLGEMARLFGAVFDGAPSHPGLIEALEALRAEVNPPPDGSPFPPRHPERAWAARFRDCVARRGGDPDAALEGLVEIRRIHEAGGDLDTVGANALFAAWTLQEFEARHGHPPVLGRDYDFDFVNYHEPFDHLARHAGSDVFLPDFPLEAVLFDKPPEAEAPGLLARIFAALLRRPEEPPGGWTLRKAAEGLRAAGGFLARFDDHHPYTRDRLALLEGLERDGLLGAHTLSGGIRGEGHLPPEQQTCGTDLVHAAVLAGTAYDSPGLEELRRIAHVQDLHLGVDATALELSKLIGSKFSKYEMAERLGEVRTVEELTGIMTSTGWASRVSRYEEDLGGIQPRLTRYLVRLDYVPRKDLDRHRGDEGGLAMLVRWATLGRVDLGAPAIAEKHPEVVRRIIVALAPIQGRKETRLNVASALQYVRPRYPMDYFFYLWGSPFLTTRRVNDEDDALDLSVMCATIGKGGGHPGAASTKIDEAEDFVREDLARTYRRLHDPEDDALGDAPPKATTFLLFVDYLARRVERYMGGRFVGMERLGPVAAGGAAALDISRLTENEGSGEATAA